MKHINLVKKLIELFGKMDGLKILTYGSTLLSLIAGLISNLVQKKVSDQTMKEEVEKAVRKYLEENRGAQ